MKNKLFLTTILLASTATLGAQVRVDIRIGAGHPLVRPGRTVIVRERAGVVFQERVAWAPPVIWTTRVVVAPPRERLIWEDTEVLHRGEDWVDSALPVNNRGYRLLMRLNGRAQVDFAEVHFHHGQAQVVDFKENLMEPGTYSLLDFPDGRQVDYVRVVARARAPEARLSILMAR